MRAGSGVPGLAEEWPAAEGMPAFSASVAAKQRGLRQYQRRIVGIGQDEGSRPPFFPLANAEAMHEYDE
ncbi:hypothetical protein ELF01_26650 [Salmonella enterica subsp. enterica serovar Typhimurium]|nr:hypothetical protein [Salmonella enterica subsp. enterica serovar Typhimurium]